MHPSAHVSLIGESGISRNGSEALRLACNSKPRGLGSQLGAKHFGRDTVGLRKAARYRFARQALAIRPCSQAHGWIPGEIARQAVGPVVLLTAAAWKMAVQRIDQKRSSLVDIPFRGTDEFVQSVQMAETADSIVVMPRQPDQSDGRGYPVILVGVEVRVNQHVARGRTNPSCITRLLERAADDDRRVSVQVPVARHVEIVDEAIEPGNDGPVSDTPNMRVLPG